MSKYGNRWNVLVPVLGIVGLGYAKYQRADGLGERHIVGLGYKKYQQTDQQTDGLGEQHTL